MSDENVIPIQRVVSERAREHFERTIDQITRAHCDYDGGITKADIAAVFGSKMIEYMAEMDRDQRLALQSSHIRRMRGVQGK